MRAKLFTLARWALGIAIAYVMLNMIQFSWFLANPEGYWSFWVFVETFCALFFAICLILGIVFFLCRQIAMVFEKRKAKITAWMIIRPFLFTAIFGLFAACTLLQGTAFNLWLSKSMAERYSFLTKSEQLIEEGRLAEAMDTAERIYLDGKANNIVGYFFIFTHLYQCTDGYQQSLVRAQYEATINMAYCVRSRVVTTQAAEPYLKEAHKLSQSKFLRSSPEYAIYPQTELAELYLSLGEYEKADLMFTNAKQLVNAADSRDVMQIINLNEVFARTAEVNSDRGKAFGLRKESLKLYEQAGLSIKSELYHQLVLLVAQYSMLYHQVAEAGSLLIKIMPTIQKHKKKEVYSNYLKIRSIYCSAAAELQERDERIIAPSYWEMLINLFSTPAPIAERFYRESESCALAVMEFRKERSSMESHEMVSDLAFLATFYTNRSNYVEAAKVHRKTLQILGKNKFANERYYYQTLLSLACTEVLSGQTDQDARLAEFEAWLTDKLQRRFLFLISREREAYANELETYLSLVNLVYLKNPTPKHLEKVFNNTLLIKNLAFYSDRQFKKTVSAQGPQVNKNYAIILKLKDQLQQRRQQITAQKYNRVQESIDEKERKFSLLLVKNQQSFFEKVSASWQQVYNKLEDHQAVVEFIRLTEHKNRVQYYRYYALIGTKQLPYPQMVVLGNEEDILAVLDQKGGEKERIEAIYEKNNTKLYELVWQSINQKLPGIKKVFISPYGAMHRISFNALLVNEDLDISIMGSSKGIIDHELTPKKINTMLFGDISYGNLSQGKKEGIHKVKDRGNSLPYFHALPFSSSELTNISQILRSTKNNSIVLKGKSASETAFRSIPVGVNSIHLATHGIYMGSLGVNVGEEYGGEQLFYSIVALAGANTANRYSNANDGILTAREVAELDLSQIDLAVLSSCESGIGKITGGEGVYGFQRGFKLAGVHAIIVSLWKVPDQETEQLMTAFYRHYTSGKSKSTALKLAQKEMSSKYPSPYYWGAFVLIDG